MGRLAPRSGDRVAIDESPGDPLGAAWTEGLDPFHHTPNLTSGAEGTVQELTESDIFVIPPYNAQVKALTEALPEFRIGTVDKFQGQEAPISIYSMATSSSEEAPHGMEFLYSLNRLNVATRRAHCLAVVVASPGLLRVRCRTPRQMRLANSVARLVEMAAEPG